MRKTMLLLVALLSASCGGLASRAKAEIDRLDVNTSGVAKALADAQRVQFAIELADVNRNGRLDSAEEWFALLSGVVATIASSQPEP